MKKILILNMDYLPKIGGVENSIRSISSVYLEKGYEVDIVVANEKDLNGSYRPKSEDIYGAKVKRLNRKNKILFFITSVFELRSIVEDINLYDVVISRNHFMTVIAYLAGLRNIKYVIPGIVKKELYINSKKNIKSKFFGLVSYLYQQIAIKVAYQLYVFSDGMYKDVESLADRKKIYRCFPGCDVKRFHSVDKATKIKLRSRLKLPIDKKIVLCIGRLEKVKGFESVINAMKLVNDNVVLVIVGSGTYKEKLKSNVISLGLEERVFFHNATNKPEEYFQLSDVFVMSSIYEPFGQVILEATFCKLQVLALKESDERPIQTATEEIFRNHQSLVSLYRTENELSKLIERNSDYELNIKEYDSFIYTYSWNNLANFLEFNGDL